LPLFTENPRRVLLGNSGHKRAGVERPGWKVGLGFV
jgi:hypothetical protein